MKRAALVGCLALFGCANGLASTGESNADAGSPHWPDASAHNDAAASDAGDCKVDLAQPWQGVGVTAAYIYQSVLVVIGGDRFWGYDYSTNSWGNHGHLEELWSTAPKVDDLLPWQDTGVRATYVDGTTLTIISGDRYWTVDVLSGVWGSTGHLETLWSTAPSNGGVLPWQSPGVQAAYVYQSGLTIVSADRYWILDLTNGTWGDGMLETTWAGAPKVDSDSPWEPSGVSASWVYGDTQTILSADRYWISNVTSGTWSDTGHLETVWSTAPAVDGCQ